MLTIHLLSNEDNTSKTTMYKPTNEQSLLLMQHCVGAELIELNATGLEKLEVVADAHNWQVEVDYL